MTNLAGTSRRAAPAALSNHLPALRSALEQQRRFRVHQLRQLATASLMPVRHGDDPWDEVALAVRAAAMAALSDIEAALHRIEAGRYGRCEGCDTAIPLERLEILPMASHCMRCQYVRETGQR
jgi:RNA polymerase-binding transcription factor DksA